MKNKFLTSTLILILGGFVTRMLGFIIKIVYTRMILEEGVGLHSLVMPTYSLLITIATLSLPLAISKLVSEEKTRSIKIIWASIFIILLVNFFIVITMMIGSKFIAYVLLKNEKTYYLLIACTLTLPFISLSSIIKGYFFGKQNMMPYAISNSLEQVVRLLLIVFCLPYFVKKSILTGVTALILLNIVSEIFSIFVFCFFIPKKVFIKKEDLKLSIPIVKDVLNVSLPTVSSRFIGNIGFFFEPIILTNILLFLGYSSDFILLEYGAYNAYSISLLTMPNFFVSAVSNALIPEVSKFYQKKNYGMLKRRFNQAMFISFLLGIFFSIGILIFKKPLLFFLYHTESGIDYIRVLAPIFVLFYLEGPIISTLQGLGFFKFTMKVTLYGVFIKNAVMALFSLFRIGIYGLIISEIVNIIFVVGMNLYKIKKVWKTLPSY